MSNYNTIEKLFNEGYSVKEITNKTLYKEYKIAEIVNQLILKQKYESTFTSPTITYIRELEFAFHERVAKLGKDNLTDKITNTMAIELASIKYTK